MATTEVTIKATRDSLAQIVEAEPGKYRQAEVGRILGVSRQRAHVLVNQLNLSHLGRPKHWSFYCLDCGKPIHRGSIRCWPCWLKIYGAKMVTLTCDFPKCGKQFERKESEARGHKFHFCSRSCRNRYGRHYGFGTGKARVVVGKTMPNNGVWQAHGEVIKQLVGQGVSMAEIGRRLGVSRERIRVLLKKHNLPTKAPMLNQRQAAALLGCCDNFLTGLDRKGLISPIHSGLTRGPVYYPEGELKKIRAIMEASRGRR